MQIINLKKGKMLSDDAGLRRSFTGRLLGLMFQGKKDIVLEAMKEGVKESTIHMMFMRYPIDVVWTDSHLNVVDVKKNVPAFNPFNPKTWRLHGPKKPALYILEFGKGDILDTEIGDVIEFID